MSIECAVLGGPGRDNAVLARVATGQATHRLLFDCGEGCVAGLPFGEVRAIEHLFFSHLHMDHVGGFDSFFRAVFNRMGPPNRLWGPPETIRILHHRLRGYLWNLYEGDPAIWQVNDVHPDRIERARFAMADAFERRDPLPPLPRDGALVLDEPAYALEALQMDHHTPSLAYILREKPRPNVATGRLAELGLAPGPWLRRVKEAGADAAEEVEVGGARRSLAELRAALVVETPGDSLAYLTDFLLGEAAIGRLAPALGGVGTVVCECQYRAADAALAERHRHMAAPRVAELARRAGVGRLILFHLSDRYRPPEWLELLAEARAIFPNTHFPTGWGLAGD